MAIFHLTTKPLSRSTGRSAVAAAAYRSGTVLTDMRQGLTHDYERRFGVEHQELVLPEGADAVYWTRQQLWNAAEFAEARKDGRTAREWLLALPDELSNGERQELALTFARELAGRYGCAVDVGIHLPDKEGDQRNHHAHLLATTRVVAGEGLGDKTLIELSDAKRLSMGLGQGRQEIEQVRALWAERANQALERKGRGERIDPRSLVAQQEEALMAGDVIRAAVLDRMPEIKVGWKATAMERRTVNPIATERGDQLRAIKQENTLRKALLEQLTNLNKVLREAAAQLLRKAEHARQQLVEGKRKAGEERRRQEEIRTKQRQERELQEQQRRKGIESRAEHLWSQTAEGRAEKSALEKLTQAQQLQAGSLEDLVQLRTALEQWKKEHPVKSRFYKPEGLEEEIVAAEKAYLGHMQEELQLQRQVTDLAVKHRASLPQWEQQAEKDLQLIAVKLTSEQVRLLIDDAYAGNREAGRKAFTQVEQRTHTARVLNDAVELQRFEQEGFGGILQQKDKSLLDGRLNQLQSTRKQVAARQLEKERSRERETDVGHGDD